MFPSGDAEQALFDILTPKQGNLIYLVDNIDYITSRQKLSDKSAGSFGSKLSSLIAGIDKLLSNPGIVIIASSTLDPKNIYPALLSPNRLNKHAFLPLPNMNSRSAFISNFININFNLEDRCDDKVIVDLSFRTQVRIQLI